MYEPHYADEWKADLEAWLDRRAERRMRMEQQMYEVTVTLTVNERVRAASTDDAVALALAVFDMEVRAGRVTVDVREEVMAQSA